MRKTKFEGNIDEEGWQKVVSEPWVSSNPEIGVITQNPDVHVEHDGDGFVVHCPNCGSKIDIADELPFGYGSDPQTGECDECETEVEIDAYWEIEVMEAKARTRSARLSARWIDSTEAGSMNRRSSNDCQVSPHRRVASIFSSESDCMKKVHCRSLPNSPSSSRSAGG